MNPLYNIMSHDSCSSELFLITSHNYMQEFKASGKVQYNLLTTSVMMFSYANNWQLSIQMLSKFCMASININSAWLLLIWIPLEKRRGNTDIKVNMNNIVFANLMTVHVTMKLILTYCLTASGISSWSRGTICASSVRLFTKVNLR